MKKYAVVWAVVFICSCIVMQMISPLSYAQDQASPDQESGAIVELPKPSHDGDTSVEQALRERRSLREYKDEPLTLSEVSQLLWAAQGITHTRGYRTAPSAGALYPLEVYLVVGNVNGLAAGIYRYQADLHQLVKVRDGDRRAELSRAALGQAWVADGAVILVFAAVYERTTRKYGERGIRYVHIEVGHAAQNVYLEAVALNLGTVMIGAFYDDEVKKIIEMRDSEQPLAIMPVGRR